MNKKGFTLIELLIVIAIIGIIAAIAIPNMLMAMQRSRQKGTILVMHNLATGIESYKGESTASDFATNVNAIDGIAGFTSTNAASFLVPMHLNVQPNQDRWGNNFQWNAASTGAWMCWFASFGKDQAPSQTVANVGSYQVTTLADFENDIIFTDGQMSYGPNTTGRTGS